MRSESASFSRSASAMAMVLSSVILLDAMESAVSALLPCSLSASSITSSSLNGTRHGQSASTHMPWSSDSVVHESIFHGPEKE